MSIGNRIWLGYGVAVVVLIVLSGVRYMNTRRLIDDSHWVTHTHSVLENVEHLSSALHDQEAGLRSYLLTENADYLELSRLGEAAARNSLEQMAQLTADNPPQQLRIRELRGLISVQDEHWSSILRESHERGFEAARATVRAAAGKGGMDAIDGMCRAMIDAETQLLVSRSQASEETANLSLETSIWGTALAVFVIVGFAYTIARSITGPLSLMTDGATKMGGGDLSYRIAVKRTDEIGVLSDALNHMAENLSKTLVSVETEKRGRERVEQLLATIAETANDLVSATAEISAATSQQSAGAQEQAAAVAQTVTTVNAVVQTSEQAADRARTVADTAQRSLEVSRSGRKVIEDSVQMMSNVKERVEASTEGILSLAEQAQSIGAIITSVSEIAEQTNLLALNAAIEASRAGEQGKGFGVVAAEVKALAGQSKKATQQVRQILGEIQRATSSAVMTTEECSKSVNSAVIVIMSAGDTIRSLSEVISQAAQAATQIAASAGQQATGTAQIHQAMQNIDQVTVQNLGSTRQMEQAAKDLNLLGGRLRERLTSFERGAVG
ncbi:MAG: hypothetical protein RL701_5531 [Pseudomonadota bacterium]